VGTTCCGMRDTCVQGPCTEKYHCRLPSAQNFIQRSGLGSQEVDFFLFVFFFFFFETGSCHGAQACLYLPSAGIIGMYYHSQVEDKFYSKYLFCFFFVCLFSFFLIFFLELGSCYIAQAGFGLLGSSNPPASASPKTRTIGTHHHAWFFVFFQVQEQRHWSLPA
jgi:hypothetical protein